MGRKYLATLTWPLLINATNFHIINVRIVQILWLVTLYFTCAGIFVLNLFTVLSVLAIYLNCFSSSDEMSVHKIQSDSGPLTMNLEMVPKMLSPLVSIWGPDLYVASFKLETDPEKLIAKATAALKRCRHYLKCFDVLSSHITHFHIFTHPLWSIGA